MIAFDITLTPNMKWNHFAKFESMTMRNERNVENKDIFKEAFRIIMKARKGKIANI
jgi:hypothetical protein